MQDCDLRQGRPGSAVRPREGGRRLALESSVVDGAGSDVVITCGKGLPAVPGRAAPPGVLARCSAGIIGFGHDQHGAGLQRRRIRGGDLRRWLRAALRAGLRARLRSGRCPRVRGQVCSGCLRKDESGGSIEGPLPGGHLSSLGGKRCPCAGRRLARNINLHVASAGARWTSRHHGVHKARCTCSIHIATSNLSNLLEVRGAEKPELTPLEVGLQFPLAGTAAEAILVKGHPSNCHELHHIDPLRASTAEVARASGCPCRRCHSNVCWPAPARRAS
mmetsp:Transcript_18180/g.57009  ORF Transcript_18180/g.57009 Transcript_18180/m.57009 type:complete len:276 (+) Transcript_18180:807-1634(+)